MTTKPPTTPLEHIKQARATAGGEWSWDERLEAARALGWGDVMAGPQEEMKFNEGGTNDRCSAG